MLSKKIIIYTQGHNSKYQCLNINESVNWNLLAIHEFLQKTRERENVSTLVFVLTESYEYMFHESSEFHSDKMEQISPQIKIA